MPELVDDGDRRAIVAGPIRLAFGWTGDRWDHAVERLAPRDPAPVVMARSVEGDPARDDPTRVVSPAYQQLEFQADGAKLQALLVGQSGPHHFSAVFEVEQRPTATGGSSDPEVIIRVDVADRCRGVVEALAATYSVDAVSSDLIDASPSAMAWALGAGQLTFTAIEPARIAFGEGGRRATQVQALAGVSAGAATRRYAYAWHWTPDIPPSTTPGMP